MHPPVRTRAGGRARLHPVRDSWSLVHQFLRVVAALTAADEVSAQEMSDIGSVGICRRRDVWIEGHSDESLVIFHMTAKCKLGRADGG